MKLGSTERPFRSICVVLGPASARTAASVPVATIVSPRTASACTIVPVVGLNDASSTVTTFAL